jgi:ATP-binding protein involved in chromosome partitioning
MTLFKRSFRGATNAPLSEARLREAADGVADPLTGRGLVASGRIQSLSIAGDRASAIIEAPAESAERYGPVRAALEAALLALPGVAQAQVVLTAERTASPPPRRAARLSPELERQGRPGPAAAPARPPHVRHVLAVASGKGGVGKSTVAVNLALAFARRELRVGLLDADVYGPSAPRMLGLSARPEITPEKAMIPLQAHGLKVMSIGFLLDAGAPLIWRGPMATSALQQMATGSVWGSEVEPLDVLVVDLPPGTGDIQLTLVQKIALTGAVVVSTPQELALDDARRGAAMFAKTGVPVLGIVENMAWFEDPTGVRHHLFGEGGARRFAEEAGLPFLGEVPLDAALRLAGDTGAPVIAGPAIAAFDAMAERLTPSVQA